MAESTLSISLTELRNSVGMLVGYGADYSVFSTEQKAQVDLYVDKGYRLFLSPPILPGERMQHRWSFLSPVTTLSTITEYSTGTVTVVNADATITLAGEGAAWPTWAAGGTLIITDGAGATHELTVLTRTDNTHVETTVAWDHAGEAGLSYEIHYHPADYDLADAFGAMRGDLTYESDGVGFLIRVTSEGEIRTLRTTDSNLTGFPRLAAVRWKAATGTTGQRAELLLWPQPDAEYTVSYMYDALVGKLTTEAAYPLGGMMHGQTLEAACRAVAEREQAGKRGVEWSEFYEVTLPASIMRDRRTMTPQFLGYNGDRSAFLGEVTSRHSGYGTVSYNGETIF